MEVKYADSVTKQYNAESVPNWAFTVPDDYTAIETEE